MAAGDLILSRVVDGAPNFPCGGCADTCHDAFGDTLDFVLTGVIACTSCFTNIQDMKVNFTGVNIAEVATWDGAVWTFGFPGATYSPNVYSSSDGSCSSGETSPTGSIRLEIACTGSNVLEVAIIASASGATDTVLFHSVSGTIGDVIPNLGVSCGQSGIGSFHFGATGGTITITLP